MDTTSNLTVSGGKVYLRITGETIFIFAYCYYVFMQVMNRSQFVDFSFGPLLVESSTYVMALGCIVGFLMCSRLTTKFLTIAAIMGVVCVLVMINNDRNWATLLLYLCIMCAAMVVSTERVFRAFIAITAAALIFTLLLYFTGVYQTKVTDHDGRVREYLGFSYTTDLPNYFFHLLLAYFVVCKRKINIIQTVVIFVLNYLIFKATDTKAVFYSVIAFLVLLWLLRLWETPFRTKLFRFVVTAIMPALAVLAYFVAIAFNGANSLWHTLNEAFTGRLSLMHRALEKYGFTPFGTEITWALNGTEKAKNGYLYVDDSYLNIGLAYGLIVLVLIVISFAYMGYRAHKEQKYVMCIALIMLAVHSFSDPQLLELKYNPFLLLLVGCWVNRSQPIPLPNQTGEHRSKTDAPQKEEENESLDHSRNLQSGEVPATVH